MWVYIVRRSVQSVFVMFLVTLICFVIMHVAPGNPFKQFIAPPPPLRHWINEQIHLRGLDQPVALQYVGWLWKMIHGNFGNTMLSNQPIAPMLWPMAERTLILMLPAWLISIAIAIPWSIHNSLKTYGISDMLATVISFVGFSAPSFWVALELQRFFAYRLLLLPPSSMHAYGSQAFGDLVLHSILPVSTLVFMFLASYLKYVRNSFLDVLPSEFVRTARAKGVGERRILYRHALRNALVPIITVLAMDTPQLFGGSAIVEIIFNWFGIGHGLFDSAMKREYPTMMAIIILTSLIVVFSNWLADILYAVIDPRVRTGKHAH